MDSLALTLLVVGSAMLALPFLDPKDDRARIALAGGPMNFSPARSHASGNAGFSLKKP